MKRKKQVSLIIRGNQFHPREEKQKQPKLVKHHPGSYLTHPADRCKQVKKHPDVSAKLARCHPPDEKMYVSFLPE
jgi:hypothetical protein